MLNCVTCKRHNSILIPKIISSFKSDEARKLFISSGNNTGILSREIIRNWRTEWWKHAVLKQPEALATSEAISFKDEKSFAQNLLQFYKKIILNHDCNGNNSTNKHFVVASRVLNGKIKGGKEFNTDRPTDISIFLFSKSNAKNHSDFVHDWSLNQSPFYKKYFFTPNNINLVYNYRNSKNKVNGYSVTYDIAGEKIEIERSSNSFTIDSNTSDCVRVAIASVNFNNLLLCTLHDALQYRDSIALRRPEAKLLLHRRLAPIKCYVEPENYSTNNDIKQLTAEIAAMLRTKNLSVWNDKSIDLDEIGIPFTLIIPDNVIDTGIVYLRDISTFISMEVAVPQIDKMVLKYLHLD